MTLLSEINPIAFQIGSIEVRWYGIVIVFGMILGLIYVCCQAKKINLTSDDGVELFLWIIPLAVIFARILYVIPGRVDEYFPWESWEDVKNAIAIWDGGITIIGGIVGGILGGIIFTIRHRKKVNFGCVADIVVVPLLLGQVIGRFGNLFNQEAFGLPITNPTWQFYPVGVYITKPSGVGAEFRDIVYNHIYDGNGGNWFCATYFYEQVWNLIGMGICLSLWKKETYKKYPGLLLFFYIFWYCLGRFWLEFIRMDALPVTKVACIVVAPIALILGIFYILYRNTKTSFDLISNKKNGESLKGFALSQSDIKAYAFVGKVLSNPKNPLKVLFGKNAKYEEIDFEKEGCHIAPKTYKKDFRNMKKNLEYQREVNNG